MKATIEKLREFGQALHVAILEGKLPADVPGKKRLRKAVIKILDVIKRAN